MNSHSLTSGLRPEHALLLACARTSLDPQSGLRVRELVRTGPEWASLTGGAAEHGLLPLLYTHLKTLEPAYFPSGLLDSLRASFDQNLRFNMFLSGVLVKLLRHLEQGGLEVMTYKGPVAAQALYGNLALRCFSDLDLLVRHRDVPRARELVQALGFAGQFPAHLGPQFLHTAGQYAFVDPAGTALVELHSERTLRHFPRPLDPGWLWEDSCSHPLASVEVRTLGPEKLLLALCVHGAKDFWSRIKWIADIGEWLRVFPQADWPRLFQQAGALGCARILRLGVFLVADLLQAELPEACARSLAADPVLPVLGAVVRRALFHGLNSLSLPQRFWFRFRLLEAPAEGARYVLRLATTPAEDDWAAARLPAALAPAYALLRPFRLLRKYGLGSRR